MKHALVCMLLMLMTAPAQAQTPASVAIQNYIKDQPDYATVAGVEPDKREATKILNILPKQLPNIFARYVAARSPSDSKDLRAQVERLRLNKQVASPGGTTGVTSLVSRVAAPSILGLAVEYGGILQNTTGSVTTLRGNLLGIARLAFGSDQFPDCPEGNEKKCQPVSRWLRRFSGMIGVENTTDKTGTGKVAVGTTADPIPVDLFGNDFRMSSWGARFDLTANDPDDPKYTARWKTAMATLRGNQAALDLTQAVTNLLFQPDGNTNEVYDAWEKEAMAVLRTVPKADFQEKLEAMLDILIKRETAAHPDFLARVAALNRSYEIYAKERDGLLRDIQLHQFSVEYTNQHPRNQATTSNVKLIYSHQPSKSPLLVTANAGFTLYNAQSELAGVGRFRDVQLAGQIDWRLGELGNLGNAVLTFGTYYQWMREDALINIGPGNVAPGSTIILPGTAAKLLGTKGHIGIIQGKLSIPVGGVMKVPISVTWSNRTELIKESDTRGQVGVTLDVDMLFK